MEHEPYVEYFVPLSDFERQLVTELSSLLNQNRQGPFHAENTPSIAASIAAFNNWTWSSRVIRCMNEDLEGESLQEEYQGDRSKAYNGLIHFLAHTASEEQNLARAESVREINPDFLLKLGNRPICDVKVKPVERDLPLWTTISKLYQECGQYWKNEELLSNPEGTFTISELIRKYTLHWQWPENKEMIDRVLIRNPSFDAGYTVKRDARDANPDSEDLHRQTLAGALEKLHITQRSSANSAPKVG